MTKIHSSHSSPQGLDRVPATFLRASRVRPVLVLTAAAGLFTTLLLPATHTAAAPPGPAHALVSAHHPDDEAEGAVRPPSGPVVPAEPDDGALESASGTAPSAVRPAPAAGDSSAALETSSSTERIAPGVTLQRQRSVDQVGFLDGYVLRADLDGPTRPTLIAPTVSGRDTPTSLAAGAHAVAATNGDFFAIDTSNAPIGPEVKDGALIKAGADPTTVVGLDKNGVGRIADLMLEGSVTVAGVKHDLAGLNPATIPADSIALYTPDWCPGDRHYAVPAGHAVEVEIRGGKVVATHEGASATPVPAGSQLLLATGSLADSLAATPVGTLVTVDYHARTSAPSPYSLALGAHLVLVRGGQIAPIDNSDQSNSLLKPRTALGWTAHHQLVMYVADGSSSVSRGLTAVELAQHMKDLGAVDAVMLDGGGSSQLVARKPGDTVPTVTNAPSDGSQRIVPNAVGLVPPTGSGKLHGIDVRLHSDRVFPGLSRDVAAAGYDETVAPAPLGTTRWSTAPGDLAHADASGVLRGGKPGSGTLRAESGRVTESVPLRVLGSLDRLEGDVQSLSLSPSDHRDVTISGRDAEGFSAPIEPRDISLKYDHSVVSVTPQPDGTLRITALAAGDGKGTVVEATVQGHLLRVPTTVGLADVTLGSFADASQWTATSAKATATVSGTDTSDRPGAAPGEKGLRLSYDMTNQPTGTSAAYAVATNPLTVPAGAQRLSMWVRGDGSGHWLRGQMRSQGTTNVPFTFALNVDWNGWRRVEGLIPTGFTAPLTLERIYLVQTDPTKRTAGSIDLALLQAGVGVSLDVPDVPDQPDPAVIEPADQVATGGKRSWRFAVLSDTHVNADGGTTSYAYRKTARALDEIAAAKPDFVLLSGDGVDQNRPADFELFQKLLAEHLPANIPFHWAVGNHESGAVATGTLDQFTASTHRPTRESFDHDGTRFIVLNSTLASLRLSDYSQLPWLRQELDDAARDRSVTNVVVAEHHPVLDPTGTGASQLSDPSEGALLEQWLTDFRQKSGKQVALITGHAHTAHVRRVDGLLEFNAPVVGKTPYGDAGHGGFSAWSMVTMAPQDARVTPDRPDAQGLGWFRADVRPLLDQVTLDAPTTLAAGASATVTATAIDEGMDGRVVPLRYPATVFWSGAHLVVAADDKSIAAALRRRDVVAVLDRRTLRLIGAHPGTTDLTVRTGTSTATTTLRVTGSPGH